VKTKTHRRGQGPAPGEAKEMTGGVLRPKSYLPPIEAPKPVPLPAAEGPAGDVQAINPRASTPVRLHRGRLEEWLGPERGWVLLRGPVGAQGYSPSQGPVGMQGAVGIPPRDQGPMLVIGAPPAEVDKRTAISPRFPNRI
jgi:hypothetical protein